MALVGPAARSRPVLLALAVSVLLLIYGNAVSALAPDTRERVLLYANVAVTAVALVAASLAAIGADELGLAVENARASALWGLAIGLAVALPPVVFILVAPLVTGSTVQAGDLNTLSGTGFAFRILVRVPIATALAEEVLFRGVLFALWHRVGGLRGAVLGSSFVFALWHLVIAYGSVADADVVSQRALVVAGYAASLVALFIGGLFFALLRWRTANVAGPAAAHWVILAMMQTAIWARG